MSLIFFRMNEDTLRILFADYQTSGKCYYIWKKILNMKNEKIHSVLLPTYYFFSKKTVIPINENKRKYVNISIDAT